MSDIATLLIIFAPIFGLSAIVRRQLTGRWPQGLEWIGLPNDPHAND